MPDLATCPSGFILVSDNLTCSVPLDIFTETEQIAFINAQVDLSIKNTQLTYADFQLLGSGILLMFVTAFALKQVRLIINR